ncbi:MAG: PASTA domain-containing protein, partial [Bacillota bacterium]|nr:PASTA domain-containing protein [Bacillota bacterium]
AQYSETIPPNYVADQDPAPGTAVKKGQRVTLFPSQGPEWVEGGVPDLRGMSLRDAQLTLVNHRLQSEVESRYDDEVSKDAVITSRPGPGEPIRVGDKVVLLVSLGPEPRPVTVPDVVGLMADEARGELESVGLKVGEVTSRLSGQPKDVVVEQKPAPGGTLMAGDAVDLVVSAGCENSRNYQVTPPEERYSGDVTVTAYVQDQEGRRRIFQGTTPSGTSLTLPVCWAGDHGVLQIYFNGELAQVVALP